MNICFFNWEEPSGVAMPGGIPRAISLFAKELRRRGHSVEFYFGHTASPACSPLASFFSSLIPSLFNHPAGTRFRKFLKERKIDVAVWHKSVSWAIPLPLKNLPCRLITFSHNQPSFSGKIFADKLIRRLKLRSLFSQRLVRSKFCCFLFGKFFGGFYNLFFFYAVRYSDKFVLLSEGFIPEFAPAKKFPEKVCAIPNIAPFGVQNIDFSSKGKELLWLGRMDFAQKHPDFMLQIWQRLQDRFPDWKLRFVGDGGYLPKLKALASSLGLKNVFFEGFQAPPPYYRSAPIFCMTSAFEGFGLVLVEAQAYGCVPVAFESFSAVRDIIEDGVNGYLVPPFDLDAYAEKLAELMSDSELREKLALKAQKSVAKFSAERVGDQWEKLLLEVQAG